MSDPDLFLHTLKGHGRLDQLGSHINEFQNGSFGKRRSVFQLHHDIDRCGLLLNGVMQRNEQVSRNEGTE